MEYIRTPLKSRFFTSQTEDKHSQFKEKIKVFDEPWKTYFLLERAYKKSRFFEETTKLIRKFS